MTRPLPGLNARPTSTPTLPGVWGGYLLAVDDTGYTVSIPDLVGTGTHPACEAVADFTWAVGDAVWVTTINGNRGRFLIFAHRQREPL